MTGSLAHELAQVLAELELVSHVAAVNLDPHPADSTRTPGGNHPGGGIDKRDERRDDQDAPAHLLKSAGHFRRRAELARSDRALAAILEEAERTLQAWKVQQDTPDNPQIGSFLWKRKIAREVESGERTIDEAVRRYSVSRRSVYNYIEMYGVTRL